MTLSASLSTQLDSTAARAGFTGALSDAQGQLGAISITISVEEANGAAGHADTIDADPIAAAVTDAVAGLGEAVAAIPGAGDLIGSVQAGVDLLNGALGGTLEQDVRDSLDALGRSFETAQGSGLEALRQLAEGVTGSGDLAALSGVITQVLGLAGRAPLPEASTADLVGAALSVLETIGAMMTLDSLLREAAHLGQLGESHFPEGRAAALLAAVEAELARAEAELRAVDPADAAAVDAALAGLGAVHGAADALIEGLRNGMAMGEATLTVMNPAQVAVRAEAVLADLRGAGQAAVRDAITRLAAQIAPLLAFETGDMAGRTLEGLLGEVEAQAAAIAVEIDGFDPGALGAPLAQTLGTVTQVAVDIQDGIAAAMTAVTDALDQVRRAIEALPLDVISGALRDVAGAIGEVLDQFGALLDGVQAAIGTGAQAAQAAMSEAEAAIVALRDELDRLFGAARVFVEDLNLAGVVGQAGDAVQEVADLIAKADMAPYFATAQGAIRTTTSVVEKVPFAVLPDSMEQDLVDAIRPVKSVDLDAFAAELRDVLQISEDGSFALRPELEAAVAGVQDKIAALLVTLEGLDPRQLVDEIDATLAGFADAVRDIEPAVALGPVTDALAAAKAVVADLDPDALIAPLRAGFDAVLTAVDAIQPSALLAPVEAGVSEVRTRVLELSHLDEWAGEVDALQDEALRLAALADPATLEEPMRAAFEALRGELAENGLPDPLAPLGALLGGLLSGGSETVMARSMEQVADWLRGTGTGGAQLETLARGLAQGVERTRAAVVAADPGMLAARLAAGRDRLDAAVADLSAGAGRDRLASGVALSDLSVELGALSGAHGRYVGFLEQAEAGLGGLVAKGFGEADSVAGDLRAAFAPLAGLLAGPRDFFAKLGFTRFHDGMFGLIDELFSVATPERLAGILMPVYRALHGRLEAILSAVLDPVRAFIGALQGLVSAFDLAPLSAALDAVFQPVRDEIAALHPDAVLGDALAGVGAARDALAGFDPLGPVLDVLEELQGTILRVLGLLDGAALLEVPIAIHDEIRAALEALDLGEILTPLYDQLDAISAQVGSGLSGTVDAFQGLQDALPDRVGSVNVSVSVSAGAG